MGDIYLTTNSTNPSSIFLGTTWQKIEGRFLLGTSGSGASKQIGGSNSKTIARTNLPNIKLSTTSGTASINDHYHYEYAAEGFGAAGDAVEITNSQYARAYGYTNAYYTSYSIKGTSTPATVGKTSSAGGEITGTFSLQTEALGSGQSLDITPSYYTVHMWLRLT